jgi:PHD/YefM family antitoxin component YafN of YafNO toxin-antitoxin module
MKKVNALTVRNKFGQVLEMLDSEHEPILISKGKKLRAVLISYEDFQLRFIDKQAEEEKQVFLNQASTWRDRAGRQTADPIETLRTFRGYKG